MFLLSIAVAALSISTSTFTHQVSAFVPSTWQTARTVTSLTRGHDTNPAVAVSPNNHNSMQTRHYLGVCTKLWAEAMNDDEGQTPKATTNKGAQKETSSNQNTRSSAAKKSKSTSKTSARKTKGAPQKSQTKKQPTKKPLEISSRSLSPSQTKSKAAAQSSQSQQQELDDSKDQDDQNYAYNIPKTGYSLADQLENNSQERFETTLTPIVEGIEKKKEVKFQYDDDGFPISFEEAEDKDEDENDGKKKKRHEGVARIDTMSTLGNVGEEPVRWLVSLGEADDDNDGGESYAMIDLPPYSDKLANEIRSFMDPEFNATDSSSSNSNIQTKKATLDVILITNQQCIHYDTSPAVYVTRKSDLTKWKKVFPSAQVVMYRLDIPRECREEVTQVLDGYGPWAWEEDPAVAKEEKEEGNGAVQEESIVKFVETGRPLQIEEWDDDTKSKVLTQGELPPDDQVADDDDAPTNEDDALFSPEAIRQRELKHRLLAVYTPGHTFGSITYIFPQRGICCSGYTLPLESSSTSLMDDYEDDEASQASVSSSVPPQGPRLDYQGYLATSASRPRQMSSALSLINNYIDRFRVVLPARGDVVFLDSEKETRKRELMESVGLYQKIGDIYGRLGIVE